MAVIACASSTHVGIHITRLVASYRAPLKGPVAVPACVHLTHFATTLTRSWAPWGSVGLEIRRSRLEEVVSRFRPLEAVFGLQDHPEPIQVEELRSGGAGIVPHGRRRPE